MNSMTKYYIKETGKAVVIGGLAAFAVKKIFFNDSKEESKKRGISKAKDWINQKLFTGKGWENRALESELPGNIFQLGKNGKDKVSFETPEGF